MHLKYRVYSDVNEFHRDTYAVLMLHEAQNMVPLGNVLIGVAGIDKNGWRDPANWYMATVADEMGIHICAIMTPPHRLTLYATNNEFIEAALSCLISGLRTDGICIPGVMSERTLAHRFADEFCRLSNLKYRVSEEQLIYTLEKVNPDLPVFGELRLINERDLAYLPFWLAGFDHDVMGNEFVDPETTEQVIYEIGQERFYVLEVNGTPVTMARIGRVMQTVCSIGPVYTPQFFRRNGYASSCVALLCKVVLDRGYTNAVLYTNLANPTSNSIYRKIGFTPICESLAIDFIPEQQVL